MTSVRTLVVLASAIVHAQIAFGADTSEPAATGIVAPHFKAAPKAGGLGANSVTQGASSNRPGDAVRPQGKPVKGAAAAGGQSRRSAVGPPCKPHAVPDKSVSGGSAAAGSAALPAVQSRPGVSALPAEQSKSGSQALPAVQSKPGSSALPAVQSPAAPELREKPAAPTMPR